MDTERFGMNYYEHHLADYTQATAHLSMLEDAAYSRMLRWYYANEKPLPADVKQVERLVRAQSKQEREAISNVLAEFFVLHADGWHQDRADREISKYQESEPDRAAKRENEKERQRRSRERRKAIFDTLREHGIVPAYDTPMNELQTLLSRVIKAPVTEPVTRDATGTHTPDTRHHIPIPVDTHTLTEPSVGACVSPSLTPAGAACLAMRAHGIGDVNPSHPTLLALIEAGATTDEFAQAGREASQRSKGFAYAIGTVKRRREEAAKLVLHRGGLPNKQQAVEAGNRAVGEEWERKMRGKIEVSNAN